MLCFALLHNWLHGMARAGMHAGSGQGMGRLRMRQRVRRVGLPCVCVCVCVCGCVCKWVGGWVDIEGTRAGKADVVLKRLGRRPVPAATSSPISSLEAAGSDAPTGRCCCCCCCKVSTRQALEKGARTGAPVRMRGGAWSRRVPRKLRFPPNRHKCEGQLLRLLRCTLTVCLHGAAECARQRCDLRRRGRPRRPREPE